MAAFVPADIPVTGDNAIDNLLQLKVWTDWACSDLYGGLGVQDNNGRNRPRYMWDIGQLPDGQTYIYTEGFTPLDKENWGIDGKKPWANLVYPSNQLVLPASYKS